MVVELLHITAIFYMTVCLFVVLAVHMLCFCVLVVQVFYVCVPEASTGVL